MRIIIRVNRYRVLFNVVLKLAANSALIFNLHNCLALTCEFDTFWTLLYCYCNTFPCLTIGGVTHLTGLSFPLRSFSQSTVGFVSVSTAMADAFGDDLFSVFDEEQSGSGKKATPKSGTQSGYVNRK